MQASQDSNPSVDLHVAAVQCALGGNLAQNVERVSQLTEKAAAAGAQIICLPELFEGPYFCTTQDHAPFALAKPLEGHPSLQHFSTLARRHRLVIAVPFFEKQGPHYYNSVAVVDADGEILRNDRQSMVYRKSHIPQGPGYEEKYYFRPGNTGFATWKTAYGRIGVGICWDQWFPECARSMVLRGAEVLLYPTAIGSEPKAPDQDTQPQWQLAMRGHAVSNRVAVVAANRVGREGDQTFYGSSFIANHRGEVVGQLDRQAETFVKASLRVDQQATDRAAWGFFRDRRPDLYGDLCGP
jgi:N-carbamoylputrescine amidase